MADLRAFDPTDAVDAVADAARREVAQAALRLLAHPEYLSANPRDQFEGMLHGMMTGVLGTIVHTTIPGAEAEIRAVIAKNLNYYFDRALEIGGREPLGEVN